MRDTERREPQDFDERVNTLSQGKQALLRALQNRRDPATRSPAQPTAPRLQSRPRPSIEGQRIERRTDGGTWREEDTEGGQAFEVRTANLSDQKRELLRRLQQRSGIADLPPAGRSPSLAPRPLTRRQAPSSSRLGPPISTSLVNIKASGNRAPLICIHPVSGSAYPYFRLASLLHAEQPVHGFESPGLHDAESPLERIEDLAGRYVRALDEHSLTTPCVLAGWSMGGVIAFEMARQLAAVGNGPAGLILLDTPVPLVSPVPGDADILLEYARHLSASAGKMVPAQWPVLPEGGAPDTRPALFEELRGAGLIPAEMDFSLFQRRLAVFRANMRALHGYEATGRYRGAVTLIQAAESPDTSKGWADLVEAEDSAGFRQVVVAGSHFTMWADSNLPPLAATLAMCLDAAQDRASSAVFKHATGRAVGHPGGLPGVTAGGQR